MTNIAILTGRIAREPDTRETKGGTNVTGIATKRSTCPSWRAWQMTAILSRLGLNVL